MITVSKELIIYRQKSTSIEEENVFVAKSIKLEKGRHVEKKKKNRMK